MSTVASNSNETTLEANSHADTTCLGGGGTLKCFIMISLSMFKVMTPLKELINIVLSVVLWLTPTLLQESDPPGQTLSFTYSRTPASISVSHAITGKRIHYQQISTHLLQ